MRKIIFVLAIPMILMAQTTYQLRSGIIPSGSGISSNSNYSLTSVFGMTATGVSSNSTYTLFGGMPYPGIYVIVEEGEEPALGFKMMPLSPNPSRDRVLISFVLPEKERVRIEIYDISGRRVWSYRSELGAGKHEIVWDSRDVSGELVPSGIYLVRFKAKTNEVRQKLLVIR